MTEPYYFFGLVPEWLAFSLFTGVRLAVWGCALALVNIIIMRRLNNLRWWLYENNHTASKWLKKPRFRWPKIDLVTGEGTFLFVAIALALTPLISFTLPIFHDQLFLLERGKWPVFSAFGMHFLLAVEIHYLWKVALNPQFKMKWVAGWYLFSMIVAFVEGVSA